MHMIHIYNKKKTQIISMAYTYAANKVVLS